MKVLLTLFTAGLLTLTANAVAGHDDWRRGHSSNHGWAHKYASTAVRQANRARSLGCRYHGQRWSRNYDQHYQWAVRTDRFRAEGEIDRRQNDLRSCRSQYRSGYEGDLANRRGYGGRRDYGHRSREDFARWYADTATGQARQNHRHGCREKGNAWTTDWYDHYRWALRARRDEAVRQIEQRDYRLNSCRGYSYRR